MSCAFRSSMTDRLICESGIIVQEMHVCRVRSVDFSRPVDVDWPEFVLCGIESRPVVTSETGFDCVGVVVSENLCSVKSIKGISFDLISTPVSCTVYLLSVLQ